MKELGIYVHIPFCVKKCLYCDFISYSGKENCIDDYIDTLLKEIKNCSKNVNNYKITTIYIGGGTPSFIDSGYIVKIIECIKQNYNIDNKVEITIELNPGTIDIDKLRDYKKCGINRISIGLQTTNNSLLKRIGRIHTYEQFLDTYNLARKVGFKNINVDLILALPNQSLKILQDSLNKVIELNPEHISIYSLILECGTPLTKMIEEGKEKIPSEKMERKMYWVTKNILEYNGYIHYEISNFARKGKESKHNLNCWNQKEYIGVGLASHSYINKTRYSNTENLEQYINEGENKRIIHEIQTKIDEEKEYMMLGLRKIEGIKISEFKQKFVENPIYLYREELRELTKQGLIVIEGDIIKLTNKGLDFANLVWEKFV